MSIRWLFFTANRKVFTNERTTLLLTPLWWHSALHSFFFILLASPSNLVSFFTMTIWRKITPCVIWSIQTMSRTQMRTHNCTCNLSKRCIKLWLLPVFDLQTMLASCLVLKLLNGFSRILIEGSRYLWLLDLMMLELRKWSVVLSLLHGFHVVYIYIQRLVLQVILEFDW